MSESVKNASRARRARKIRHQINKSGAVHRLQVHRTNLHIYAQILDRDAKVIVSASTAEVELRKLLSNGGNIQAGEGCSQAGINANSHTPVSAPPARLRTRSRRRSAA